VPDADQPAVLIALEAVLQTEQLHDLRRMVDLRLVELPDRQRWAVTMVVDELVTNALEHAGRCIGLRISRVGDDRLRVEVDDPDPATPPTTGRGLQIVESLAVSWGVQQREPLSARLEPQDPSGKTVWCELDGIRPT
jgi:two-component sensor histidine kinase